MLHIVDLLETFPLLLVQLHDALGKRIVPPHLCSLAKRPPKNTHLFLSCSSSSNFASCYSLYKIFGKNKPSRALSGFQRQDRLLVALITSMEDMHDPPRTKSPSPVQSRPAAKSTSKNKPSRALSAAKLRADAAPPLLKLLTAALLFRCASPTPSLPESRGRKRGCGRLSRGRKWGRGRGRDKQRISPS